MQEDQHRLAAPAGGAAAELDAVAESDREASRSCSVPAGPGVEHARGIVDAGSAAAPRTASATRRSRRWRSSPSTSCAAASAAPVSRRFSLSALVSRTSSLTEPLASARRDELEQLAVDLGEAEPRVDQHDDRAQAAPHGEVLGHHLLPAQLGVALDRRVAVAGQVGEERIGRELRAELEQVDVLGAARRLRGEREALLLRQDVDRRRLAGIRAADEGDLGQLGRRAARRARSRW